MSESKTGTGYGLSAGSDQRTASAPLLNCAAPRPKNYDPAIALIGCGGISEYHLRAYREMGWKVVALCDRLRSNAEKRRMEFFPEAQVVTDYREVLRRDDIHVVDIALHPVPRFEVVEAALRAGKHVLSQKPFVLDLAKGEHLVALAETNGVKLAVNQNGRWAPHFSYLAAAIEQGVIGDVASVDFTLQWDHTWTAGTPFEEIHHLVLFDFGIHWLDMAAQLMRGRGPTRVWASVERTAFQSMKPPMLGHVAVDYPGAQVRINFNGHVKHGQEDRTVVCGSRGTLRSWGPSLSDQTVTLHTAEGEARVPLQGTWFTSGFQGAMGELLCAIEEKREPAHSARNNLISLGLCFAAIDSANTAEPRVPGQVRQLSE